MVLPFRRARVRHHTNDEGLQLIIKNGFIGLSSVWGSVATGIHVETEPFGSSRPGRFGPMAELGSAGEGAFVEFDASPNLIRYTCGPRNTALIPSTQPLSLAGLNAAFV